MATMSDNTRIIVQVRSDAESPIWEKVLRLHVDEVDDAKKRATSINESLGWEKYRVIKTVDYPWELENETPGERHVRHWEEKYQYEDRDDE